MAIAFDATTGVTQGAAATLTWSHTCTGANLILFVAVSTNSGATAVTYNLVPMTQIDITTGGAIQTNLWYLVGPATGANNIVATLTGVNASAGQACSYTGASQTGVPDNHGVGGPTTTTSYSQSLTSVADNCFAIMAGIAASGLAITAGTNTTLRQQEAVQVGAFLMDSTAALTPAGTFTLAGTSASQSWKSCMATFAPVGAVSSSKFLGLLGVGS